MGWLKKCFYLTLAGCLATGIYLNGKYGANWVEGTIKGAKEIKERIVYEKNKLFEKEDNLQEEFEDFAEKVEKTRQGYKKELKNLLEKGKKEIKGRIFEKELEDIVEKAGGFSREITSEVRGYQGKEAKKEIKEKDILKKWEEGLKELEDSLPREEFYDLLDQEKEIMTGYLSQEEKAKQLIKSCRQVKKELNSEGNYLVWQDFGKEVSREGYLVGCLGEIEKFPIAERQKGAGYLLNSLNSSPEKKKEVVFGLARGLEMVEKEELAGKIIQELYGEGGKICVEKIEKKEEERSLFDKMNFDKLTNLLGGKPR